MAAKRSWEEFPRENYLRMIDRHWPFWSGMYEFIHANEIRSIVEVGCGVGQLCYSVESYTGIDLNKPLLEANELFYERGTWLCGDWLKMVIPSAELFVASAVIEHCESFQLFLEKVLDVPWFFAVVTFSKGLRDKEIIAQSREGDFFENYYCREEVEAWLSERLVHSWNIIDLPLSRRPRQAGRESVLVIDRAWKNSTEPWRKREIPRKDKTND